jgi:hypothetical protein
VVATGTPATGERAGQALGQWPEAGHDAHNTGNLHHDGERPYPPLDLVATDGGRALRLSFTAPGDDRGHGLVERYEVRLVEGSIDDPAWSEGSPWPIEEHTAVPGGSVQTLEIRDLPHGRYTVMLRAYDDAGNGSAVASAQVAMAGWRHVGNRHRGP